MMFSARESRVLVSSYHNILRVQQIHTCERERARTHPHKPEKKGAPLATFEEHIQTPLHAFTHWKHNQITIYYLTETVES